MASRMARFDAHGRSGATLGSIGKANEVYGTRVFEKDEQIR